VLLITPCLSLAGETETVWSGEDLSIVSDPGPWYSATTSYKFTLSRKAAGDLRSMLNTVPEWKLGAALARQAPDPGAKLLILFITRNVSSFKYELNKGGTIGGRGIVIDVWVPKGDLYAPMTTMYTPDYFGIRKQMSAATWAVINPCSWRITTRA
jgi:hypothetical protein